MSFMGR